MSEVPQRHKAAVSSIINQGHCHQVQHCSAIKRNGALIGSSMSLGHKTKSKKPDSAGHVLYDSRYGMGPGPQIRADRKQISGGRGGGGVGYVSEAGLLRTTGFLCEQRKCFGIK